MGGWQSFSVDDATCSASRVVGGYVDVTTAGSVTANEPVSDLQVTGYANDLRVGTSALGDIEAGNAARFSISGRISTRAATVDCTVKLGYFRLGSQS